MKPADVDAAFRGVYQAVKSGRITEQRVEQSARKLLAAKYDLGLVSQRFSPVDSIDTIVASRDVGTLANEIAEHAITVVRDEDKVLPLVNLKPDAKIFNLAITNGDDRTWIANSFRNPQSELISLSLGQHGSNRDLVEGSLSLRGSFSLMTPRIPLLCQR